MASAKSNEAFAEADIEFHKNIFRATHNEFFWPIAQMFELALRECFRMSSKGDHRNRAIEEHRDLMLAITSHKPDRANAAALLLLENAAQDLVVIRGRDIFGKTAETEEADTGLRIRRWTPASPRANRADAFRDRGIRSARAP